MAVYRKIETSQQTRSAFSYCYYDRHGYLCNQDGTRWVYKYCEPIKDQQSCHEQTRCVRK